MTEPIVPRCYVEGCDRPLRGHGYCIGHYREAREQGWPIPHPRYATELRQWREERGQMALFGEAPCAE